MWLAVIGAIFVAACSPFYGFVESELELNERSRLPVWVQIPDGVTRDQIVVHMTFYTFSKVRIVVHKVGRKEEPLQEKMGEYEWHPETRKRGFTYYPQYLYITVRDTKELFVKSNAGPYLHLAEITTKPLNPTVP